MKKIRGSGDLSSFNREIIAVVTADVLADVVDDVRPIR